MSEVSSLNTRVEEALDTVRPYLNKDGGDVKVIEIKNDELILEFLGNCSSCNMSNMTLKAGIEEAVKNHVPEIKTVTSL